MSQRNELRLDRIVASQPELGPFVPDGGYGWLIFIATVFLQVFLPSILSSYGIFMLYYRLENSAYSDEPKLWDTALLCTPILYAAFWSMADPWSKTIIASSTWPRLVSTSGIFLTCAGLLLQWVALRNNLLEIPLFMLSGALSGFGSSLALTQSEILISQYFRLKLLTVTNILLCAYSLGFIIIPITLGFLILHEGILHSLLIYQAIILQCVVIISVFKKPMYLKAARRRYELLQNVSEDDEMIFAKDEITPQNNIAETNVASTTNNISTLSNQNNLQERRRSLLTNTFSNNIPQEINENRDENDAPRPIFSDVEISQTNSYSFDNNIAIVNNDNVTIITQERLPTTTLKQELKFLIKPSFYKSLFFLITVKYSSLIFWMLFPTYLYVKMDQLKVQQTTFIIGAMGLSSLLTGIFLSVSPIIGNNKQILTSTFCFLSSVGYFIVSDSGTEGWMLFGALHITSGITALHALHPCVIKFILKDDSEKAHTLLHTLTGISILCLLLNDASYKNCFRIMSTMQLIAGMSLIFSLLYSYFKKLFKH